MTWRGWEDYKPPQYRPRRDVVAPPNVPLRMGIEGPFPKRSKYGAEPTTVDGIRFDSKREAARYRVLKMRTQAFEIRGLRTQPRYQLCAFGVAKSNARKCVDVAEYVADFEYQERVGEDGKFTWRLVVEDSKGAKTDVYKLKKRWFEKQYGITIRET